MEKLLYLLAGDAPQKLAQSLGEHVESLAEHTRGLTLLTPKHDAADLDAPFRLGLCVWLSCLDRRENLDRRLRALGGTLDAYLVTESVLRDTGAPLARESDATIVIVRQAPRLAQQELLLELKRKVSPSLDALAVSGRIVRDYVVRPLDTQAPPLRAMFTFAHAEQPESAALDAAFDAVSTPAQRSRTSVVRRIVRPRAQR